MKITVEFNLPDDEHEYNSFKNSDQYQMCLFDYAQWLREKIKYKADELSDEEYKAICECSIKFNELITESNIDIYE
jgi:hypothetical protein